ncbi:hypothetical protein EXE58_06010 [Nocardioides seonyuensis]|uniref:Uncharacterized protein n=1 Tax=Nocardioides seonyuensis TaxID=2518371 RepID=A0A4V1BM41_9ACTN|nr:hypothetical protein [Nocardioides seonyuensis]QBX55052.1 hypothetical protein EXE58_06010 [Nocardioides seonyuensis]
MVIDGLFLLGTFYWASLINGLMDQELSDPVENFLFVAVRLALTVPPAVIVIFYTMCDLAGALRRVWSTR